LYVYFILYVFMFLFDDVDYIQVFLLTVCSLL